MAVRDVRKVPQMRTQWTELPKHFCRKSRHSFVDPTFQREERMVVGFALLWLETLAASLLWTALVIAWTARLARRWQRVWFFFAALLPVSVVASLLTVATGFLKFRVELQINWFFYTLSGSLVFFITAVILSRFAVRRVGDASRARAWPRRRLAVSFAAVLLLGGLTLSLLDLAAKSQRDVWCAEARTNLSRFVPKPPDGDNAASLYEEAFDNLTGFKELPPESQVFFSKWHREYGPFDPRDPEWQMWLDRQELGLVLARKAAGKSVCFFPHDSVSSVETPLPHHNKMRYVADSLLLAAKIYTAQGDSRAALDDLAAVLGIARHIMEPNYVAFKTAIELERNAFETLQGILDLGDVGPDDLARMRFGNTDSCREDLARMLEVEQWAFGLACFSAADDGGPTEWSRNEYRSFAHQLPPLLRESAVYRVFFQAIDLAQYSRSFDETRPLRERPGRETGRQQSEILNRWLNQYDKTATATGRMEWMIAGECRHGDADGRRCLVRLAAASFAYRAGHGRYPDTAEELSPEFLAEPLLDPCDSQPFHFFREGDALMLCGCFIWSPQVSPKTQLEQKGQSPYPLVLRVR
jgi:hypothetical protein